jgi:predicted P-loop ATPase
MGKKRNAYRSLARSLKKREYMKDFNLDRRIILKCVLKVDWIHIAENRDKYWTLEIIILNL